MSSLNAKSKPVKIIFLKPIITDAEYAIVVAEPPDSNVFINLLCSAKFFMAKSLSEIVLMVIFVVPNIEEIIETTEL